MSLHFFLPDAPLPDTTVLRGSLPRGVELSTVVRDRGLPAQTLARLVAPGRSTRGAIVTWSAEQGLGLLVPPLGALDDVDIAVEVALALSRTLGLQVSDGQRTDVADVLQPAWDAQRRRAVVAQSERAMRDLAAQSRLRLSGVNRAVVLGPGLMRRVPDRPGALVDWLRHTQWLPGQEPLSLPAERFGGDPAGPLMVTLEPGTRVLLAPSDLVRLPGEPVLVVPRNTLAPRLGARAALLDESQLLVERLSTEAWEELRTDLVDVVVAEPARWTRRDRREMLLPVLRPPGWSARAEVACWPLHAGRPEGLPLVSLVRQVGRQRSVVSRDELGPGERQEQLDRAVAMLEPRLPAWDVEHGPDGSVIALLMSDPFASEAILSRDRLLEAHALLGAPVMLAAVPVRGLLRLERGDDGVLADPSGLLAWSGAIWEEAARGGASAPISPDVMIVVDGAVQGRTSSASAPEGATDEGSLDMPGLQPMPMGTEERPRSAAGISTVFRGDHRAILALAVPALGSLAVEPLVSVVDTAFVSTIGDAAVGALGVSAAVLSLAFVVFNFLAYGTTPLVAEARARGERDEGGRVVVAALTLAAAIGGVGGALLFVLAPFCVAGMGASGELVDPAVTYLSIRALGAPALLLIIAGHGAYRGFSDTTTPLLVSLLVAVSNLVLDGVLILGLDLGVVGAAWASVVAQWLGAGFFLALLFGPSGHQRGVPRSLPRVQDLTRLLGVGSILSVRTVAVVGTMTMAASVATRMGTTEVAAHQVVSQLWMMAALLADGLAVAAQALLASAPTARQAREVSVRLLGWGLSLGLFLAVALVSAQLVLPLVFRVSPETLALAGEALLVAAAAQPIAALVFVGDGLYLGARRFGFAAISMVVAAAVGGVALLVLPVFWGLSGVWLALALFVAARAALLALGALTASHRAHGGAGAAADA